MPYAQTMNLGKSNEWFYFGIACLAAIFVILPIVIFGVPSGPDQPQHFQFAHAYYDSLTNGDGFPNWSDKENFGYGSIGIRFYPPLAYYALAFARILSGNWFDASWLTFMFWMVLGGGGIYFWSRWWFSAKESAIAAVFYAVIPYHLNQLYISFVYADFAAASVLVLCFAFLTRVLSREKTFDFLGLAVCYAALILTHLPTTIIGSMCLAVYALLLFPKENSLRRIAKAAAAVCLAVAASSFYWFGMITEMNYLNHASDKYSSGHYSFANRFFPLYFHRLEADFKDALVVPDVMFSLSILFFGSAFVYLFYRKNKVAESDRAAQIYKKVLPLGLFAVFMATSLSAPLWNVLPPLQKVQFPWRWMSVVAMCGALVAAASVHFLLKGNFLKHRTWTYLSIVVSSIVLIFNGLYIFNPGAFIPIAREKFENELRELPEKQNYVFWWAIWSNPKALEVKEKVLADNREIFIADWKAEERNFTVAQGREKTYARIATFYYPHWKATVNDAAVSVEQNENGVLLVPLPAEKSVVKLSFQEPPAVQTATLVSIVAWIFIFFAFLFTACGKLVRFKTAETYFAEGEFSC